MVRKPRGLIICWALLTIIFLTASASASTLGAARFQASGGSSTGTPTNNATNPPGLAAPSQDTSKLAAPDANRWPFRSVIAVLLGVSLLTIGRLWGIFRPYLGLGVFLNFWAFFYVLLGTLISGIPMLLGNPLGPLPHSGWLSPGVTQVLCFAWAFVYPMIRLPSRQAGESDPGRNLLSGASSNSILGPLEDQISEHVQKRARAKLEAASKIYDWPTIKTAGDVLLTAEIGMRHLTQTGADTALNSIERYSCSNSGDSHKKFMALQVILSCCTFRLLRDHLEEISEAAKKTSP